jgi:hypothetical protein
MILVARPHVVPARLARGVPLKLQLEQLWDAHSAEYVSGVRKFEFQKTIYGHRTVKDALAEAQFEKCCYCEGKFRAHVAGDVEHYRPKGAVSVGAKKLYPGYYWLAYTPANLYFACPHCNAYRKGSQFPLNSEASRARNHHDSLAREKPLLLDPAGPRDPRRHIRFDNDIPIGRTEAGRTAITILRLNREPLNEQRRKLIRRLEGDLDTIKALRNDPRPDRIELVANARAALARATLPDAEFSSAAIDFIARWRAQN